MFPLNIVIFHSYVKLPEGRIAANCMCFFDNITSQCSITSWILHAACLVRSFCYRIRVLATAQKTSEWDRVPFWGWSWERMNCPSWASDGKSPCHFSSFRKGFDEALPCVQREEETNRARTWSTPKRDFDVLKHEAVFEHISFFRHDTGVVWAIAKSRLHKLEALRVFTDGSGSCAWQSPGLAKDAVRMKLRKPSLSMEVPKNGARFNAGWWFGTFFIFPYIGNNHPNWLIFFRWVETTNQ